MKKVKSEKVKKKKPRGKERISKEGKLLFTVIHGDTDKKFYKMWQGVKYRCNNENGEGYKNYGGRGITYDPKWENFLGFKEDMYLEYLQCKLKYKGKIISIERKNVNGNYCKENCTFILKNKQSLNTRKTIYFKAISPIGTIYISNQRCQFADRHNLDRSSVTKCLKGDLNTVKGWKLCLLKK